MKTHQKPEKHEFNRLAFGINSSLFLAQFVPQFHAKRYKEQFPRAAEVILKSTYMDDNMDSVIDKQGVKLYTELSAKAGMQTHKWVSNSPQVLESIPTQCRASEISLNSQEALPDKILGILWCTREDFFIFKSQCGEKKKSVLTKEIY